MEQIAIFFWQSPGSFICKKVKILSFHPQEKAPLFLKTHNVNKPNKRDSKEQSQKRVQYLTAA